MRHPTSIAAAALLGLAASQAGAQDAADCIHGFWKEDGHLEYFAFGNKCSYPVSVFFCTSKRGRGGTSKCGDRGDKFYTGQAHIGGNRSHYLHHIDPTNFRGDFSVHWAACRGTYPANMAGLRVELASDGKSVTEIWCDRR